MTSPFWIVISAWRQTRQTSQLFTLNCRNSARLFFFPDCSLTWNQPEAWLHPENFLLEIQTNKFWTTCLKREGNVYIQNMKSDRKTSCGPPREFRSRPLQQISPCCRGGGRQKRQITVTWWLWSHSGNVVVLINSTGSLPAEVSLYLLCGTVSFSLPWGQDIFFRI